MFELNISFCVTLVMALAHFLWQAAIIGFVYAIAQRLMHTCLPQTRHTLGVICLLAMAQVNPLFAQQTPNGQKASPADPATGQADVAAASDQPKRPTAKPQNVEAALGPNEIAGTITDASGKPLPGVLVDAWTWYPGNEAMTDDQGYYRLKVGGDEGRVELRVSKEGYSPFYNPTQTKGRHVDLQLNSQTYIEGQVLGADGRPVADALVQGLQGPQQAEGVMIREVRTSTRTDETGRYRLYVFPDVYEVRVKVPGNGVARIPEVNAQANSATPLDVRLQQGVRFEAQVVDVTTGEPQPDVVLWSWRDPEVFGKSNTSGKIVIEELLPGEFEFQVGYGDSIKLPSGIKGYTPGPLGRWWSDQAADQWSRKQLQPGQFQRNFDGLTFDLSVGMPAVKIEVERGVEFSGVVLDPNGNPVAGATVAPAKTGSGNSLTGDTRYSEKTAEDGSFRVVMPAGNDFEYNLVVHDGDYGQWRQWANGVTNPLRTKPGFRVNGLKLHLSRPCTVTGKVNGQQVGGLRVRAHAADLRGNRYYDPTTRTNADGTFELKFIRPGKHHIQVEPFWLDANDAPRSASVVVELEEGEVREGVEFNE